MKVKLGLWPQPVGLGCGGQSENLAHFCDGEAAGDLLDESQGTTDLREWKGFSQPVGVCRFGKGETGG